MRVAYLNHYIMLDGTGGDNGRLVAFVEGMANKLQVCWGAGRAGRAAAACQPMEQSNHANHGPGKAALRAAPPRHPAWALGMECLGRASPPTHPPTPTPALGAGACGPNP